MTDLERARWLLPEGTDEVEVRELAEVIAAARREGAEAEREKVAMWMIARSIPTGHGDTVEDLLAELRAGVAEEMRERAAQVCRGVANDQYSAWAEVCETRIRALPLTPEEPA